MLHTDTTHIYNYKQVIYYTLYEKKQHCVEQNNKEIYCTRTLHRVGSMYTRNMSYIQNL